MKIFLRHTYYDFMKEFNSKTELVGACIDMKEHQGLKYSDNQIKKMKICELVENFYRTFRIEE